jgi:alcohol dehydrogenase class IV
VLDAAKFIWAAYEHPDMDWSGPAKPVPPLRTRARLALVPTTAGSGSEASRAAVLINSAGAKTAYLSQDWLPDIVVLDPALTVSLPAKETMSTGFDALAHGIESGVSSISNLMVRSLAATAIRGILSNLAVAVRDPQNLAARGALQNAAYLAGLAQSTASTGAAHGFSHATTAVFHSAHALTTGFFLPHTMQWNSRQDSKLYDALAVDCGMTNGSRLIAAVCDLANKVGLPAQLRDLVGRRLTPEEATLIAAAATRDVCMRTNACRMNSKDAEQFLQYIW